MLLCAFVALCFDTKRLATDLDWIARGSFTAKKRSRGESSVPVAPVVAVPVRTIAPVKWPDWKARVAFRNDITIILKNFLIHI